MYVNISSSAPHRTVSLTTCKHSQLCLLGYLAKVYATWKIQTLVSTVVGRTLSLHHLDAPWHHLLSFIPISKDMR